jgi:hypothetical protein
MLTKKLLILFSSFFFLFACAEEDPNLVNPPPQNETVRVRFFNLSGNKKPATLVLDGKTVLGPVDYGICSSADKPPADSSYAMVQQNGIDVYKLPHKIKFTRNNFYTVFAFPSAQKDTTQYRDIDTLIVVYTLAGLIVKPDFTYLKMINTIPKLNRTYSLRLGCPNGDALATGIKYKQISTQAEVPSGFTTVSLIRTEDLKTEIVGLFNLQLKEKKQYMIVILPDASNGEEIFLMDESSEEFHPLLPLIKETKLETTIRAINLSETDVDFIKYPDTTFSNGIFESLQSKSLGNYINVFACGGQTPDNLACIVNGDTSSKILTSLNVSEKYTLIAFDSADAKAKTLVLAGPTRIKSDTKSLVRVVNASRQHPQIIVSMASRDFNPYSASDDSLGYRSGELLSDKTSYGKISSPKLIEPGKNLPVTIFTTTEPANLVFITTMDMVAGGRYLILVTDDYSTGKTLVYLIEENDVLLNNLKPYQEGVLIQFVNLVPGIKHMNLSVNSVLKQAKMNYGASLTTVVAEGNQKMNVNGKDSSFNAIAGKRYLFIFSGDETLLDILPFEYQPFEVSTAFYQRRFINASKEIEFISIKENKESSPVVIERIAYGKSSAVQKITLDRNLSLFFVNSNTDKALYRVDDMPFPFGKNYTIIFGGRSKDKSYSVVVQQEY